MVCSLGCGSWGVVPKALVIVCDEAYPEGFWSIFYFLWSYKDFRNDVVVMGVAVVGVVVMGVVIGVWL